MIVIFYTEEKRDIPVSGVYDVIVAGSGPSGISAAVAAARGGARVLLVEYFGSVGGMSTMGLMSHFTGRVRSGLYEGYYPAAPTKTKAADGRSL